MPRLLLFISRARAGGGHLAVAGLARGYASRVLPYQSLASRTPGRVKK
jgi:hypothetical protein